MAVKNLWGDLPELSDVRSPATILREQASLLTQMTKGTLQGEVSLLKRKDKFDLTLRILAPALDNYSYTVLGVVYPIEMYPADVFDAHNLPPIPRSCTDEESLQSTLANILSSSRTQKVISHLLAQSKGDEITS